MTELVRVSVLGTLAEFHREPIPYSLQSLVDLVVAIHPDLLCLDMTGEQWKEQEFSYLPPEYREALIPLSQQSDIVIVPIGDSQTPPILDTTGWRNWAILRLREGLAAIQRGAPGPSAINHGWRHELSNLLYHLVSLFAGRKTGIGQRQYAEQLGTRVLDVAQENPGARILVVVNVQYCHLIRPLLRQNADILELKHTEL